MTTRATTWFGKSLLILLLLVLLLVIVIVVVPIAISIGIRTSVLRTMLTPGSLVADFSAAFPSFRQAILTGPIDNAQAAWRVCPDKNVMIRSTSSQLISAVDWGRPRDVVLARLSGPDLYDVSVGSLAALPRSCLGSCEITGVDTHDRRRPPHGRSPSAVALV